MNLEVCIAGVIRRTMPVRYNNFREPRKEER
jgi:hypothetical protein